MFASAVAFTGSLFKRTGELLQKNIYFGLLALPSEQNQADSLYTGGCFVFAGGIAGFIFGLLYNRVEREEAQEEGRQSKEIAALPLITGIIGLVAGFLLESGSLLLKYK